MLSSTKELVSTPKDLLSQPENRDPEMGSAAISLAIKSQARGGLHLSRKGRVKEQHLDRTEKGQYGIDPFGGLKERHLRTNWNQS